MKRIALGLLVLAAGCSDIFSPGSKRTDLDAARERWTHAGLHDYQFTLHRVCFCAFTDPMRVIVLSDTVNSVTIINNNQPVGRQYAPTIDGLFDFIDNAIRNHAATIDVTYDRARGFPTHITYDAAVNAADDDAVYDVSDVFSLILTADRITAQRRPLPPGEDQRRP